jgi:hypothetical protein
MTWALQDAKARLSEVLRLATNGSARTRRIVIASRSRAATASGAAEGAIPRPAECLGAAIATAEKSAGVTRTEHCATNM